MLAGSQTRRPRAFQPRLVLAAWRGLYVSVICRDSRAAPFLTLAGGVAVADGIRNATGLPVQIKWPNDVVVEGDRAATAENSPASSPKPRAHPRGCSTSYSDSASTFARRRILPS